MNFLNPIGWLFLSLAPVLVLLYLRRVRRRVFAVPTLLFWQRALGEQRHRAFLGKLRQWFSLLLHLLVLLLLILALVRPQWRSQKAAPATPGNAAAAVVVVDARARMQALEPDGQSRFRKAVAGAREAVAHAGEGSGTALLLAGPAPEVVSPFSTDPAVLTGRLESLAPTDATADLAPTLALARELAATRPGARRILLFTDGSEPSLPADSGVEVVPVGSALDNVAITQFAARPEIASPQTADLLLEIANFSTKPAHGNVEISCDGQLLDVKPFALEPGARKTDLFPAVPAMGSGSGRLTARLAQVEIAGSADALALDNTAYAILPANEPCRVLLVTRGNWFLEKLLAADPTLHFDLLEPGSFQPGMGRNFDAVIFDDCGPTELSAVSGNALFLKSSPLGNAGTLKEPLITDIESDHPLLRFVQWNNVTFLRATEVPPAARDGWKFQTPLRSFEHPLMLTGTRSIPNEEPQRLAVFAFDLEETDLPLRIAFPLLISNTLHWLGQNNLHLPDAVASGEALPLAAGETAHPAGSPGAKASPEPPGPAQPPRNGFYEITTQGAPEKTRWLAVNTFSEAEANLAAFPETKEHAKPLFAPASRFALTGGARPLWEWFALAGLALLTVEWWLFQRRRTE